MWCNLNWLEEEEKFHILAIFSAVLSSFDKYNRWKLLNGAIWLIKTQNAPRFLDHMFSMRHIAQTSVYTVQFFLDKALKIYHTFLVILHIKGHLFLKPNPLVCKNSKSICYHVFNILIILEPLKLTFQHLKEIPEVLSGSGLFFRCGSCSQTTHFYFHCTFGTWRCS